MNRPELSAQLADEFSVDKASADRMVTAIFAALGDSLAKGEPVSIVGFGTFTAKSRPARHGRNPRTGETIAIAASTAPSFMVGKALRDAVNSGHGWWRRRHSLHRHHSRTDRQNPRRRRGGRTPPTGKRADVPPPSYSASGSLDPGSDVTTGHRVLGARFTIALKSFLFAVQRAPYRQAW